VNGFSFSDRHLPLPYWPENNNNNNKKKVPIVVRLGGEEGEWEFEEEIQRDERESHFHVDKALHAHKTCAYGYWMLPATTSGVSRREKDEKKTLKKGEMMIQSRLDDD
jgi:hypothetical protein